MKKKYKIGEVAKLFNISRRTLLHYDEIDLFKPIIIDENNGYRYYLEEQLMDLYFILDLKKAGFSLIEIREYRQSRSIQESKSFLKNKKEIVSLKIKDLEILKNIIENKEREFEKIEAIESLKPKIVQRGPLRSLLLEVESPYGNNEIVNTFQKVYDLENTLNLKNIKYLSVLDLEDLKNGIFDRIRSTGFLILEGKLEEGKNIISKGTFASIIYTGSYESIGIAYGKLFDYITLNNYKILGNPIEIVNQWLVQIEGGVGGIAEILIPIEFPNK